MNNTIKLSNKGKVKIVAHRGLSGLELENTAPAFVAAANRSYFGIETDVHKTADGKYVLIHDASTQRVSDVFDLNVEESAFDEVRANSLKKNRADYRIPTPEEYFSICKKYDKASVFEIKGAPSSETVEELCEIVKASGHLENTIFISFNFDALVYVRRFLPDAECQFLCDDVNDELMSRMTEHGFDLDVYYKSVTKELVDTCHAKGMVVNCWTVNTVEDAEKVIADGVDFITTNILE